MEKKSLLRFKKNLIKKHFFVKKKKTNKKTSAFVLTSIYAQYLVLVSNIDDNIIMKQLKSSGINYDLSLYTNPSPIPLNQNSLWKFRIMWIL